MRYHDYHLSKYEVSDRGETITLHLVYGYPGEETDTSCIRFSNVALYNFIHTANTIITDIEELSVPELVASENEDITEWHHMHCVRFFKDSPDSYGLSLQAEGYKAWLIESAIGFRGFVIAKTMENS